MRSFQFPKHSLQTERHLCANFLQLKQRIEFALTSFQHIPHRNLTDVILVLGASILEYMTFVFPTFTLSPFISSPSFQFFNLIFNSSSDSATMTRSLHIIAPKSIQFGTCDRASITVRSGVVDFGQILDVYWLKHYCLVVAVGSFDF